MPLERYRYQSATILVLVRTLKEAGAGKKEKTPVVTDPVFDPADERLRGKKGLMPKSDEYRLRLMRRRDEYRLILIRPIEEAWRPFPRLALTGQLAERLRRSYGQGTDVLSGSAVSEQELRRRPLGEYRYLLFATHAILEEEASIQEPALVLS